MKRLFIVMITWVAVLASAFAQTADSTVFKRLTGVPKPPVAGTTIDIVYSPKDGPLDGLPQPVCIVYMYNSYHWVMGDAELTQDGDVWKGKFSIPADCAFMAMEFRSTWNRYASERDNNDDKGYLFVVSNSEGKPLPGGHLAWGMMRKPSVGRGVSGYFSNDFQEIDQEALYYWYTKEVQENMSRVVDFFPTMMSIVKSQAKDQFPLAVQTIFPVFTNQCEGKVSERNMIEMENIYRFQLQDVQRADSMKKEIIAQYPEGWTVRKDAFMGLMRSAPELYHKNTIDLLKKYPEAESAKLDAYQPFVYYNAVRAIVTDYFSGQFDTKELFDMIPNLDFKTLAECYRSSCFPFHMKKAVDDKINYPIAKALIDEMLKKVGDNSMGEGYLSPHQTEAWQRRLLEDHIGSYADILLCLDQPAEAVKYINMISDARRFVTPETNETHLKALKKMGKSYDEVVKQSYAKNAVTPDMLAIVKADYVAKKGSEAGYEAYEQSLKPADEAEKIRKEMKKKLINVAAPDFTVYTAEGAPIHSADLKDKIIILDFWASWCFPCKNSFPAMQMAVNHFANDSEVAFYFVDTMETTDDYVQKAKDYMSKKGFNFNVVFDGKAEGKKENNMAFSAMSAINHSMAIPRKMILKNGRVRYTEEGYGGSPSRLVDEISAVVELLKSEK